jgi:hypothetical protein
MAPVAFVTQGTEPSIRVDEQGTIYISSIRGVPAGIDLWRWSPVVDPAPNPDQTLPFQYKGRPDGCGLLATGCDFLLGVGEGGGDSAIAVNFPGGAVVPNLGVQSLTLANVTATNSTNRGDTFANPNPVAAAVPGDDRQWMDATGALTVYLTYHDSVDSNIEVQRSSDGGLTYLAGPLGAAIDANTIGAANSGSATSSMAGHGNRFGEIHVDRSSCPTKGNLYIPFAAAASAAENHSSNSSRHTIYMATANDVNTNLSVLSFRDYIVHVDPPGTIDSNDFPPVAVDNFGNVYVAWSDQSNIFFSFSTNAGQTWSPPMRVNQGATVNNANVFPWMTADANGHVAIVWFGDDRPGNSNDRTALEPCVPAGSTTCMTQWANWNVYVAETVNGHDPVPLFTQTVASDHVIHRGTVSTGGLGGGANRNLGDFFQVALDPQHGVNVAFADDSIVSPLCSSQTPGHCGVDDPGSFRVGIPYFTRQKTVNPGVVTTGTCALH